MTTGTTGHVPPTVGDCPGREDDWGSEHFPPSSRDEYFVFSPCTEARVKRLETGVF